ncbi:MAG TPA: lysophospholipid acyltransferase family protein [Bryobacteraceae bacterium]|nr:lysophospholipid acyltransferase family protein [Bryobacteraceae bacterium]
MAWLRGLLIADPAIVLATILFGLISLLVSFFDQTGRVQVRIARAWAKTLLAVSGVKVRVEGLEHIDPNASYIFAANHLSYMDTPVMLANIPVQFRFLAKRGLFQIPLLGTHLSRAGHIPVPREDPRAAVKVMQLAAEAVQQKRISLLIFPEGGRSRDGVLRPFKEGGAYIAIKAGAPIVPAILIGTRKILRFGAGVVLPGTVTLRLLKPIPTDQLTLKDRAKLTEDLRTAISQELGTAQEPVVSTS